MSRKYTPDVAELLPVRQYRCEHCSDQVFGNQSHYQLHLRRRHKLNVISNEADVSSYHCPVDKCVYHADRQDGRGFANLRFLRQHYQKIHMAKEYKCNECNETFLLERHLEKHQCGSIYTCPVCSLTYTSKASLQTHMRRKNHLNTPTEPSGVPKVPLSSLRTWKKSQEMSDTANSAEPAVKVMTPPVEERIHPMELSMQPIYYCLPAIEVPYTLELPTQTENVVEINTEVNMEQESVSHNNELPIPSFTDEEVERLLRDMETQTDDVDLDALDMNNEVLVPLLRNIQTQTLDNRQHQSTMTELDLEPEGNATSEFNAYPEQEAMFGLQTGLQAHMHTQTCDELFEELGLSHIQTQTHCPDGLYNTQHTQTCDEMLDEFLENFQSTCTQTRWLDWQETEDPSN
ncbi:zinc finger and BTB domain-containing protein 41 [Drosophila innubila]|uniref:zinc finger and BTB domain-containing protein 41 n=1 Tax=Drosophila innubila TaxID=198719 RepID=UPI00148D6F12|nr:zinc finger and BTB domain-containing protein 41 [Drosophila innubila]